MKPTVKLSEWQVEVHLRKELGALNWCCGLAYPAVRSMFEVVEPIKTCSPHGCQGLDADHCLTLGVYRVLQASHNNLSHWLTVVNVGTGAEAHFAHGYTNGIRDGVMMDWRGARRAVPAGGA